MELNYKSRQEPGDGALSVPVTGGGVCNYDVKELKELSVMTTGMNSSRVSDFLENCPCLRNTFLIQQDLKKDIAVNEAKDWGDTVKKQLTAIIEREGNGYVSLCPELDIASQGDTIEDARNNLREAVELFFETASPNEIQARLHEEVYVTRVEVSVG
jgi:predicted RNase H-like HicB family nuclease